MRVCLIHGSAQSPHGWDLVVKELMAWSVSVTAVDLPSADEGAEFFAQEIARQIGPGEPPVVVAHSVSGLLLPLVPRFLDVTRLIYVAAVIPQPGRSFLKRYRDSPEMFELDWVGRDPAADTSVATQFLFHDCEPRAQQWAMTTLRRWSAQKVLAEECPLDVHPQATYISASLDRTINPHWWEAEAQRLGLAVLRMDTGHAPHVSRPREVAHLILRKTTAPTAQ